MNGLGKSHVCQSKRMVPALEAKLQEQEDQGKESTDLSLPCCQSSHDRHEGHTTNHTQRKRVAISRLADKTNQVNGTIDQDSCNHCNCSVDLKARFKPCPSDFQDDDRMAILQRSYWLTGTKQRVLPRSYKEPFRHHSPGTLSRSVLDKVTGSAKVLAFSFFSCSHIQLSLSIV